MSEFIEEITDAVHDESDQAAPAVKPVTKRVRPPRPDTFLEGALDLAREAAQESAGDFGVGEHLGSVLEGERLVTHFFACSHRGYHGWRWAVTMSRVPRARTATVNEVVLLPGADSLLAPRWLPWSDRLRAGDVVPGTLLPTADNDARLEPGWVGEELSPDEDLSEWSARRAIAAELGLGRERVLSASGRDETAERWLAGDGGPDNASTRLAPATCISCGYFVRLSGRLGTVFGACTNEFSPFDGTVVSVDHGCGGHSDVVADERGIELPDPVIDTLSVDHSLFD